MAPIPASTGGFTTTNSHITPPGTAYARAEAEAPANATGFANAPIASIPAPTGGFANIDFYIAPPGTTYTPAGAGALAAAAGVSQAPIAPISASTGGFTATNPHIAPPGTAYAPADSEAPATAAGFANTPMAPIPVPMGGFAPTNPCVAQSGTTYTPAGHLSHALIPGPLKTVARFPDVMYTFSKHPRRSTRVYLSTLIPPNVSSSLPATLYPYLCKACHSFSSLLHMRPHLHLLEQSCLLPSCLAVLWPISHSLQRPLPLSFRPRAGIPHLPPFIRPHLYRLSQPRRRDSPQPCQNNRLLFNLHRLYYRLGANQRLPLSTFRKKY